MEIKLTAKDRYSQNIKCKECGATGEVFLSENDHRYAPPETKIDKIQGDFTVTLGSFNKLKVRCKNCESTFDT